jgi:transposase
MMLLKRGDYGYAYNAQAAVDEASGGIVAAALTNAGPDEGHLPALVGAVRTLRQTTGLDDETPTTVSADAGYFSHANAAEDGDGIDLLIAAGRADPAARATTDGTRFSFEVFGYDPAADEWVCPVGKRLRRQVTLPGAMGRPVTRRYQADPTDCQACPLRACCLTPDETYRMLVARRQRVGGAMRFKLRQPDARRRYARRQVIVEPVFGQMKEDRGFTTLSLRGLVLASAEYLLACLAHNLGKLLRVCPLPVARAGTVVVG